MQQPQAPQQQGVASLPMGPTPQPQQNFARGGIVAFADGGDVDADSLSAQSKEAFDRGDYKTAGELSDKATALRNAETAKIRAGLTTQAPLSKEQAVEDYNLSTLPPEQIDPAKKQIYEQLAAQRDAPTGIYTLDENLPQENIPEPAKGLPTLTAPDFVVNEDKNAGPRESDVKRIRERDKGYSAYPNGDALRVADGVRNNALIGDDLIAKMKEKKKNESQDRIKGYKADAEKSTARLAAAKESRAESLAKLKGITALPTPQVAQVPPAQQTPKVPQTPLEKAQAEYKAALAPDQRTRDDLTGRMQHLDEQSKWRREHTDMDAITKAGLAMMQAGARPGASFLGAAGAGGEAGIKSLAEARDVQYTTEEKRAALQQQLTQLERAERVAIAKFGVDSEEAKMVRQDLKDVEARKNALARELNAATNAAHLQAARLAAQTQSAAINKPAAEVQLMNYLKNNPAAMQQYQEMQGYRHPGSAGLDEDTLLRTYAKAVETNLSETPLPPYAEWKKQFVKKETPTDVAAILNKYK